MPKRKPSIAEPPTKLVRQCLMLSEEIVACVNAVADEIESSTGIRPSFSAATEMILRGDRDVNRLAKKCGIVFRERRKAGRIAET